MSKLATKYFVFRHFWNQIFSKSTNVKVRIQLDVIMNNNKKIYFMLCWHCLIYVVIATGIINLTNFSITRPKIPSENEVERLWLGKLINHYSFCLSPSCICTQMPTNDIPIGYFIDFICLDVYGYNKHIFFESFQDNSSKNNIYNSKYIRLEKKNTNYLATNMRS